MGERDWVGEAAAISAAAGSKASVVAAARGSTSKKEKREEEKAVTAAEYGAQELARWTGQAPGGAIESRGVYTYVHNGQWYGVDPTGEFTRLGSGLSGKEAAAEFESQAGRRPMTSAEKEIYLAVRKEPGGGIGEAVQKAGYYGDIELYTMSKYGLPSEAGQLAIEAWKRGEYVPGMEKVPTTGDIAAYEKLLSSPLSTRDVGLIIARLEGQYSEAHRTAEALYNERSALLESRGLEWDEVGKLSEADKAKYKELLKQEKAVRGEARELNSYLIAAKSKLEKKRPLPGGFERMFAMPGLRPYITVTEFGPEGGYGFTVDITEALRGGVEPGALEAIGIGGEDLGKAQEWLTGIQKRETALGVLAPYKVAPVVFPGQAGFGVQMGGYNLPTALMVGVPVATLLAAGFTEEQIAGVKERMPGYASFGGPGIGEFRLPSGEYDWEAFREAGGVTIGAAEPLPEKTLMTLFTPGDPRALFGPHGPLKGLLYPSEAELQARFYGWPEGAPKQLGTEIWLGKPEPFIVSMWKGMPVVGPAVSTGFQWEYLTPMQRGFGIGEFLVGAALIGVPVGMGLRGGRPAPGLKGVSFKKIELGAISRAEMKGIAVRLGAPEGPALRPVFTGTKLYYPLYEGTYPKVPGLYGPTLGQEWGLIRGVEPGRLVTPRQLGFTARTSPFEYRPHFVSEGPRPTGLFEPTYRVPMEPFEAWTPYRYVEPRVFTRPPVGGVAGTAVRPTTATMTPEAVAGQLRALGLESPLVWAVAPAPRVSPLLVGTLRVEPKVTPGIYPGIYPRLEPSVGISPVLGPTLTRYTILESRLRIVPASAPAPAPPPTSVLWTTPIWETPPPVWIPPEPWPDTPYPGPPTPPPFLWPGFPKLGFGRARLTRAPGVVYQERFWPYPELVIHMPEPFTTEKRRIPLRKAGKVPFGGKVARRVVGRRKGIRV